MTKLIPTVAVREKQAEIPGRVVLASDMDPVHFWAVIFVGLVAGLLAKHATTLANGEVPSKNTIYSDLAMIPLNAFVCSYIVEFYPEMSERLLLLVCSTLAIMGSRIVPIILSFGLRLFSAALNQDNVIKKSSGIDEKAKTDDNKA